MNAEERRAAICQLVETNGRVEVEEVSHRFGVSLRTARRDLDILSRRGLIKRRHGGAVAPSITTQPMLEDEAQTLPVFVRARRDVAYKSAIGRLAATLIDDDASVIIDAGTTAMYVAHHLSPQMTGTVLTNGLLAAAKLAPRQRPRLHLAGGTCRPETYSLVGPRAVASFEGVEADICFVGATGIHPRRGLTTSDPPEAAIKKTMIEAARRVILVADYTKFGKVSLYRFASIKEIDVIITDERMPEPEAEAMRSLGPKLLIARLSSTGTPRG